VVPWLKEKAAVDDDNVISSATTAATRGNKEGKRATDVAEDCAQEGEDDTTRGHDVITPAPQQLRCP
jgi:hypothetical protein